MSKDTLLSFSPIRVRNVIGSIVLSILSVVLLAPIYDFFIPTSGGLGDFAVGLYIGLPLSLVWIVSIAMLLFNTFSGNMKARTIMVRIFGFLLVVNAAKLLSLIK